MGNNMKSLSLEEFESLVTTGEWVRTSHLQIKEGFTTPYCSAKLVSTLGDIKITYRELRDFDGCELGEADYILEPFDFEGLDVYFTKGGIEGGISSVLSQRLTREFQDIDYTHLL